MEPREAQEIHLTDQAIAGFTRLGVMYSKMMSSTYRGLLEEGWTKAQARDAALAIACSIASRPSPTDTAGPD
jgi:hypothetical protein